MPVVDLVRENLDQKSSLHLGGISLVGIVYVYLVLRVTMSAMMTMMMMTMITRRDRKMMNPIKKRPQSARSAVATSICL